MEIFHEPAMQRLRRRPLQATHVIYSQRHRSCESKGSCVASLHEMEAGNMQRLITVLFVVAIASGCVATRKFTRDEVKSSSDQLSARINTDEGNIGELKDGVASVRERVTQVNDKVTQVDGKVTELDTTTGQHGQQITRLNGDVQTLDQKTGQAKAAADR